jgi:Fe-S-cluster containining protein
MGEVSVRARLKVWGDEIELEMTLPDGPTPLENLLPVFHRIADSLVDLGVERSAAEGRTVSCRKGCGACCRQLVPIGEDEARRIGRLVEDLPEPRRGEIRARFERAHERLVEAGLLAKLENRGDFEKDEFASTGLAYFRLGIPCPFLEDESCSIHPQRPISCREYLVTSPAVNCADPSPETIDLVKLPGKVWSAVARSAPGGRSGRYVPWVPLVLAPDWAARHPDPGPRPVEEVVRGFFRELAAPKGP